MQLGFRPKGRQPDPSSPEEDPVYRRRFLAAATSAGVSIAAPSGARRRLGSTDVDWWSAKLAGWIAMDNKYGGTSELERLAAQHAQRVIELQQHSVASQRVRSALYTVAAAFSNNSMWAAVDGQRLDIAQQHLYQTVTLAGLSNDASTQLRVWGHAAILYKQLGRPTDALAAAEVSRSNPITRRDPFYASLTTARVACYHAQAGEKTSALRGLDLAQAALSRCDTQVQRPSWTGFYDQAELDHLAMLAHLNMHSWVAAEQHAHRSLAYLRPGMERNRALVHAHLALAQLGQGDIEPAVASAQSVPVAMAERGRIRKLLNTFSLRLGALAPDSIENRNWTDHWTVIA